jgi:hypothetical protein
LGGSRQARPDAKFLINKKDTLLKKEMRFTINEISE